MKVLSPPGPGVRLLVARRSPGVTLLELTVVILVLLALVTVLFIGGRAWKRGSDRAMCIVNIQAVQKAVRGHSNLYGYNPGDVVSGYESQLLGPGRFVESSPNCPGNGSYTTLGNQIPVIGTLYMTCSQAASEDHQPDDVTGW